MSEEKRQLTVVETSHVAITSLVDHYTMVLREQERTHAIERSIMRAKAAALQGMAQQALRFANTSNTPDLVIEELKKFAEVVERGE